MKPCLVVLFAVALVVRPQASPASPSPIVVRSATFSPGGRLPQSAGAVPCGGANRSPALSWSGVPPQAHAVAILMYDPASSKGGYYWNWIVYNIPSSVTSLAASVDGANLPKGAVAGVTSAKVKQYSGPCPPRGSVHRYHVGVYALRSTPLPAWQGISAKKLAALITEYSIVSGGTTATWSW
jgi:Raf kinase inhibitor-like YbhB/YbcL family protein